MGRSREPRETAITAAAAIAEALAAPVTPAQPRARGSVTLSAKARDGRGVISDLRQSGAMKCLFPRVAHQGLEAVLVNTAGGITGGDRFLIEATALKDAPLTITTQAAERAYRAQAGEVGRIETRLAAGPGARLAWLPQETILFQKSDFIRRLTVDLSGDARFLMSEPVVFGRLSMGESLTEARFRDRIEIRRDGDPIYLDALALQGDIHAQLQLPAIADGAVAMASLVYAAPDAETHLDAVRSHLPETGGASLLAPDLLVARILAPDSHLLRRSLIPILTRLHGTNLPRCWMI